ncbi:bestrophin-4 isoform X4 [Heteronotia binoei]|uniref:bestrophin-4 isoform X4 n=1 Tax=Heteronotia binoei TaxID=13085 RepID=UPI00292E94C9|nr:bestrophin-4 isoform X4 [Heteronotia binoei]
MTVSYTLKVANARFGGFSKLLFRWKGSIYKLLYKEFLVFVLLYATLSVTYRHFLNEKQKHLFSKVAQYCNRSTDLIPLSFVLGFMTQDERKKFESLHSDFNKYWIPCVWFTNLAAQARRDGRIRDDVALRLLMDELNLYRSKCSMLFHYDWISIPLVYTQVVTIAVYSFFAFCVVGRQFLQPLDSDKDGDLDMYVPLPTLLQFFFYAGWLKVAEQIINPFGEDDDDFETNKLIDRNLQVSLLSVDDMYQNLPPTGKDKYWNESTVQPPYTMATAAETLKPSFMGSTFDMRMSDDPELNQQKDASPNMTRIQTPLLNRFLTAAASPAVSLKNFGKGSRIHHQLLRARAEGTFPSSSPSFYRKEDPESVGRIEEEETEDEETRLSVTPTSDSLLGVSYKPENTGICRKELPHITVMKASDDSISITDQPSN